MLEVKWWNTGSSHFYETCQKIIISYMTQQKKKNRIWDKLNNKPFIEQFTEYFHLKRINNLVLREGK